MESDWSKPWGQGGWGECASTLLFQLIYLGDCPSLAFFWYKNLLSTYFYQTRCTQTLCHTGLHFDQLMSNIYPQIIQKVNEVIHTLYPGNSPPSPGLAPWKKKKNSNLNIWAQADQCTKRRRQKMTQIMPGEHPSRWARFKLTASFETFFNWIRRQFLKG